MITQPEAAQVLQVCPFCGSSNLRIASERQEHAKGYGYTTYSVCHPINNARDYRACRGSAWGATEAEAIAAWNRRAPIPEAAGGDVPVAWRPIESAPRGTREMFVVKAFNVCNGFTGSAPYTSDPWCVWRDDDGGFARWNHKFQPTHWCQLPAPPGQDTGEAT